MDQLPDDVLAMVMSLLDVLDVFSCRLVCKKLASVSLHPDVWRHRRVHDNAVVADYLSHYRYWPTMGCPVLRLAPCLRELQVTVPSARCHQPFATTCAVRNLSLFMMAGGALEGALLIRQIEALGRLRTLSCSINRIRGETVFTGNDLAILLGTMASTSGLERLDLSTHKFDKSNKRGLVIRATVTPSLKYFSCALTKDTEHFCNFVLAAHAPTLEAVGLETLRLRRHPAHGVPCTPCTPAAAPAALLARLPNLRRLSSRLIPGLEGVAACKSLRELTLYVDRDFQVPWTSRTEGGGTSGAVELLRHADQLRSVHLVFPRDDYVDGLQEDDHDIMGDLLIRALARTPLLDTLIIEIEGSYHDFYPQEQLLEALSSLPALRRLSLKMDPGRVLLGFSSAFAPSLRSLRVQAFYTPMTDKEMNKLCAHTLLHSPTLRSIMGDSPLLHVEIEYGGCPYYPSFSGCNCDLLDCHEDLENLIRTRTKQRYLGIFAHPEGLCPSPEHHPTNIHWINIDEAFV